RCLCGLDADAVAVAGKTEGSLARAALVGNSDVHEADGFFGRAAARAGDSGDADADGRAGAFADAVCESKRHLGTDSALRFDQLRCNADERGFQFVAV